MFSDQEIPGFQIRCDWKGWIFWKITSKMDLLILLHETVTARWTNHYTPQNKHGTSWNLKMDPWKRRFLLETIISRFHVNFWGCTFFPTIMEVENGPLGDKTSHSSSVWPHVPLNQGLVGKGYLSRLMISVSWSSWKFHRLVLDIPSLVISTSKTPKFTAKSHLPGGKGSFEPTPSVSGALC